MWWFSHSCVRLFETPWAVALQAPLFMGFSRQQYWSGFPLPSPGDLPIPGIELGSPVLQADSLATELLGKSYVVGVDISLPFLFLQPEKHKVVPKYFTS